MVLFADTREYFPSDLKGFQLTILLLLKLQTDGLTMSFIQFNRLKAETTHLMNFKLWLKKTKS